MSFLSSLEGNLQYGAGKALQEFTGALNSAGISTPNLGLSSGLISDGLSNMNGGANPFVANAPYGLNPTPAQQQSIALSSVPYGPAVPSGSTRGMADMSNTGSGGTVPGTSSGGNSSFYLHPQTVNGQSYDLSDPTQMEAYRQAMLQSFGNQRDQTIAQLQRQTQEGINNATLGQGQALGTYKQNALDYARSLANNVVNLGQGHDLGQVQLQQMYAGMSPNAFQSSQLTSQDYNNNQYNKGLTQLHQNAAENVGDSYLTGGVIDPNSAIGKEIASLNQAYNQYISDAQNNLNLGVQGANRAYGQAADQTTSNLQNLAAYAGKTAPTYTPATFNYTGPTGAVQAFQTPQVNPFQAPNLNISQYTPYVSASQLSQSPQAQAPAPSQNNGSSNPFASLLGYTPTPSQANYLNAFTAAPAAAH